MMLTKKSLPVISAVLLFLLISVASPVEADISLGPQSLQGTWLGNNGQESLTLTFMGNNCVLALNGRQMAGVWQLAGNLLSMQFQNGKSISYSVAVQGDALILDGNLRLTRTVGSGDGGFFPQGGPQPFTSQSPLEGTWSVQNPQGKRSFHFMGNRYAQSLNGQVMEEGVFQYTPDGRFLFQVTGGQYAGQSGEDRITINGNSITVAWPDGTVITFTRDSMGPTSFQSGIFGGQPGPSGAATPLEGRWLWAKQGPVSFGYIFSGNQFMHFYNGMEKGRGTFTLSGMQLVMQHESGPEAGRTDVLGYQLHGNRLLIFTSEDPNIDPIPFVRQ